MSRAAVSKHLAVLRRASLVKCEKVGRQLVYHCVEATLLEVGRVLDELSDPLLERGPCARDGWHKIAAPSLVLQTTLIEEQQMDVAVFDNGLDELAGLAQGPFGPPPAGEWSADLLLAHLVIADYSVASFALAIAAGHQVSYDNRLSLDGWKLHQVAERAGSLDALVKDAKRARAALRACAANLSPHDLSQEVTARIVSNDEVVIDGGMRLEVFLERYGGAHLPMHLVQLRSLLATSSPAG